MSLGTIDYVSIYFKYKTLTPIRDEPTNKTLKMLKLELKANASSLKTNFGGGNYGYLGLVLTNMEYAIIPHMQLFILPNYPALLVISIISTPI